MYIILQVSKKRLKQFKKLTSFIFLPSKNCQWPLQKGLKTTCFRFNHKTPWKCLKIHLILVFYNRICSFYDHLWIFVEEKMMVTSLADNQKFCQYNYVFCCTIIPLKSDARLDISGVLLITTMYACYGPAFAGEEQIFQDQWSRKSE